MLSGLLGYRLGVAPGGLWFLKKTSVQDVMYLIFSGTFLGFILSVVLPGLFTSSLLSVLMFGAGVGTMAVLNKKVIKHDVCCDHGQETKDFGLLSLGAMAICSTNDGVFLGLINPPLLSLLSISMLLHKLTISFMVAHIIYACSLHAKNKLGLGAVYLVISPVTYTLVSLLGFSGGFILASLLGFSGGLLTYVALAGTLPRVKSFTLTSKLNLIWLLLPLLLSLVLGLVHFDSHFVSGHSH